MADRSTDLRALARERFAEAEPCLSALEIIARYADDIDEIGRALDDGIRPDAPDARICELGFGSGWLLEEIHAAFPGARLHGLDLSPGLTANAAQQLGSAVALVQGDMERLPFRSDVFDVVATCWTMYFMDDIDGALGEIKRTLRPGGKIVCATVASDSGRELDELAQAAAEAAEANATDGDVTERFNLDSGAPYMERHFRDISRREWRGWLSLPDVATLVRFWELQWAPALLLGERFQRVRAEVVRLGEEWFAREGELRVTRHGGVFVGRK